MDDDIYAYEQEMLEIDEWDAMHEHDIEAAEEEMRMIEMEQAVAKPDKVIKPLQKSSPSQELIEEPIPSYSDASGTVQTRDTSKIDQILQRCARLLGEDDVKMDVSARVQLGNNQLERSNSRRRLTSLPFIKPDNTLDFLMRRPPMDVDSIPVILEGGERMFIRKKATTLEDSKAVTRNVHANSLLQIPIGDMIQSIERRQLESALAKDSERKPGISTEGASTSSTNASDGVLWLDKYRPTRFVDLLSDERTNREVLTWLKKWDTFVFPHKRPNKPTRKDSKEMEDLRPIEKIILICGPPGAGKTTLANIVARHAGYNPIEVNASDDRTSNVLRNKIISAMEMQSVWGNGKPNCIILDEIDGAMNGGDGKTAIATLQQIISAPLFKSKNKHGNQKNQQHPLTRPLICICNDQYASVLRPLRKLAKIFVLQTPNQQRLMSRLKHICRLENLTSTTSALANLCENGENDIRYCLNALQFCSRKSTEVTTASLAGILGQKDLSKDIYSVMNEVFYQPSKSSNASATAAAMINAVKASQSIYCGNFSSSLQEMKQPQKQSFQKKQPSKSDHIYDLAYSFGNPSLIINGLHENIPKMIFNDPTMTKITEAFEWMGLADAFDIKAKKDQQYILQHYIPYAAVAIHRTCCTSTRRRVEYPRSSYVAQQQREKSINILDALVENSRLSPSIRCGAGVLVTDVVPWLLGTLCPNIRKLNTSLQTVVEKASMHRLIELMSNLGLSYRPKYLPDGTEDYALEPALHELVTFKGQDTSTAMLPVSMRKMIAREVELENMRRTEGTEISSSHKNLSHGGDNKDTKVVSSVFTLNAAKEAGREEMNRKRNPFAYAHREAKRKRDEVEKQTPTDSTESVIRKPSIRFKYNEGYTCGIKTTVYMRDLL